MKVKRGWGGCRETEEGIELKQRKTTDDVKFGKALIKGLRLLFFIFFPFPKKTFFSLYPTVFKTGRNVLLCNNRI